MKCLNAYFFSLQIFFSIQMSVVFLTSKVKYLKISLFQVSKEEHKSFRDLVWHLIYARDITNELEKAR